MTSDLKSLFSKLNKVCRTTMEAAAGLCQARTHYEVDLEHVLAKLLEADDTDLLRILRHYDINLDRLKSEFDASMDSFKTGNMRTPVLSPRLPKLLEQAWLLASVDFNQSQIRSGHLLLAVLGDNELSTLINTASKELGKVSTDDLKKKLAELVVGTAEDLGGNATMGSATASNRDAGPLLGRTVTRTPALDQYTVNLTDKAKQGKIDPVLGRDREIRQMVDILMRRRQNNPILTGEAGVGKTAIVEGFALRIALGDVPATLKGVALHILDLGLLQAGASVKGEFENRIKSVIEEVKASPHPIILFIDEAHTLIGAGGSSGQSDAANLLKPALARGELRTIAATTWAEYKKYFEKDAALTRRFQVVKVDEPSEENATIMLRGLVEAMERHHQVRILDQAVMESVRLSHRYLSGRQLPDKAVSVLDTACARVAIMRQAVPSEIEDFRRRLETLATEMLVLGRENAQGVDHAERLARLEEERGSIASELEGLEARWRTELDWVGKIDALHRELDGQFASAHAGDSQSAGQAHSLKTELAAAKLAFAELQAGRPLVPFCVDGDTVGEVISAWTGIPAGKMLKDEINTVRSIKALLEQRVIGQSHALDAIAQRIRTARANLEDPGKPIGVFLLLGPSGVGKTETAVALADILYGGERNLITINMSEYQEAHTVSGLKGSPPGYVGYGEGGVLTEAVRRKPYSVVLLDEVEKAHPDVLELFFQVFDKGVLDDAEGREIDFKNTVIILTSNAGTDTIMRKCADTASLPNTGELIDLLKPDLQRHFKPAFLGRLQTIPYYPVQDEVLRKIIELKLGKIAKRIGLNHRAEFHYDGQLVESVLARCTEVDSGARNVDHILTGTLLPEISDYVLAHMAEGKSISAIRVSVVNGSFTYEIE